MGKRSNFERAERDFYPTPPAAVYPLLDHLDAETRYIEPCAGDGALIRTLEANGHRCVRSFDIDPGYSIACTGDATDWVGQTNDAECFITNPPWRREVLHPIIANLCQQLPTWLLFDADWPHTKQSVPYMHWMRQIVPVGRVKWIEGSKHTGKDNCCWYLFDANGPDNGIIFHAR